MKPSADAPTQTSAGDPAKIPGAAPAGYSRQREGLLYGLAAYGWWGLVPLYFRLHIDRVGPFEILAHRILWSMAFLGVVLASTGRWRTVHSVLRQRPFVAVLAVTTVLIAINWLLYILAVVWGRVVQASLGYFLTPLVSVCLGMIFFHERLRRLALDLHRPGLVVLLLRPAAQATSGRRPGRPQRRDPLPRPRRSRLPAVQRPC